MSRSTRAFLIAALIVLPAAALLNLLALMGMAGAWPAMVHLTLFGWITLMIVAVNYHTMPVFSGRDFPFPRLIWGHWAALSAGLALATAGTLAGWGGAVAAGLLLELAAALLFVANTILLFARGAKRPHSAPTPPIAGQAQVDRIGTTATKAAGVSLPLALLGLLAQRLDWIGGGWLLAAEHLATLGWLMLMIAGVAYHVLPRFSGRGTRGPRWARAQVACHLGALALIVPALGLGWVHIFALGGLLMALAVGLFAWTVWPAIHGGFEITDRRSENQQFATCDHRSAIPLEECAR
jgi:hypothetical protein